MSRDPDLDFQWEEPAYPVEMPEIRKVKYVSLRSFPKWDGTQGEDVGMVMP